MLVSCNVTSMHALGGAKKAGSSLSLMYGGELLVHFHNWKVGNANRLAFSFFFLL